uniref:LuxR C-terminal-related transcriptional regulator n=1 Tax=Flavobacterium sp. TaxID=239 RepID=UPI00404B0D50
MIKVCVADNHPVVHFGLKKHFESNKLIRINHQVTHFLEVIEAFRKETSDILILDLELQDLVNIMMIKTIFTEFPGTRIIVFSNLEDRIYAPHALKAGASAYVNKNDSLVSLTEIIIRVNKGDVIINEMVQKNLSITPSEFKKERLFDKISNRELQALKHFCDGKKNHEIAELMHVSNKTVATYKSRLLSKLKVSNVVDMVNKALSLRLV